MDMILFIAINAARERDRGVSYNTKKGH
jgi:hypothetical protein